MNSFPAIGVLLFALAAGWTGAAAAETVSRMGGSIAVEAAGDDVRAAGATVAVSGTAETVKAAGASVTIGGTARNIWAAGAKVTIDGTIRRRLHAMGGTVTAAGSVADSAYLAGGSLTAGLKVSRDLRIAGGSILVTRDTVVEGETKIAGAEVTFDGTVRGPSYFAGGIVTFNGTAEGKVTVAADKLVVGPNARIVGELVLIGDTESDISPTASLSGAPRHEEGSWWQEARKSGPLGSFKGVLIGAAIAFIAGIVLLIFARGALEEAADRVRGEVLTSFSVGIGGLILVPIVIALVAATLVGIPIAIALAMTMPFVVIGGYAAAVLGVADFVANRSGTKRSVLASILYLLGGAIAIGLLCLIPYVGPVIVGLVLLIGFGAMLHTALRRMRAALPA